MDLDLKTYDDLPSSKKISLNFVSQGICLAINSQEATASKFMQSTVCRDSNRKASLKSNINWEILLTASSYLSYGTSKENNVCKYQVGIV